KRALLLIAVLAGTAHAQPEGSEAAPAGEAQAEDPSESFNFFNFSYKDKDEYGGKLGDGKMERTLPDGQVETRPGEEGPMAPPLVFMLINFAALLIILAKFGRPTANKIAQDRHDQIKVALDEAAKLRDQAAKKLADFEARIKGVDDEIKQLVD